MLRSLENSGCNFDVEQVLGQGQQAPVVAIFAGMLIRRYTGRGFTVCSSSASKYYLNLEIPEVQEFRASLCDPHIPITCLPCQQQNPVNPTELVNSWRTVEELKSLNPHELQNARFLCRATLKGLDCTKRWSYLCSHCKTSISGDGSEFWCIHGCPNKPSPVQRYMLSAVMADATGTMNVMIFDDEARELVGVTADVLFEENNGEDDGSYTARISAVVASNQSRAFVVAFKNESLVVKCILNDDALAQLQLKGSVKMEPAVGGPLSQEEGSPASYNCSSRIKKERTGIKEEREVKRLKTANEEEQTNAG